MNVVRAHFRPEFLNRIDDLIVFDRLSREDLRTIVDIQFAALATRLEARRVEVELSGAAADWLAEQGYDPSYGARPLKRLIQRSIADPLALRLLDGTFGDGDRVRIDANNEGLSFAKA